MVFGVIIGSLISSLLSGNFEWQWVPSRWVAVFGADPVRRIIVAIIGGICLVFGARWTGGCTSGHMMSGMMQTALSGYLFALAAFIAAIPVAILIYKK